MSPKSKSYINVSSSLLFQPLTSVTPHKLIHLHSHSLASDPSRFPESGDYRFFGRAVLSELLAKILQNTAQPEELVVYGIKGAGKSYIIAAIVNILHKLAAASAAALSAHLAMSTPLPPTLPLPVVFLPHAGDLADSLGLGRPALDDCEPPLYLMQSLALAFAHDDIKLAELLSLRDIGALCRWTAKQRFVVVIDQVNSLEDPALGRSAEVKAQTRALIAKLSAGHLAVKGYSANNQTAVKLGDTQLSVRQVRWFEGYTEAEYLHWLTAAPAALKLDAGQKTDLAEMTGRVPLYLGDFLCKFASTPASSSRVKVALNSYASDLATVVSEHFADFLSSDPITKLDRSPQQRAEIIAEWRKLLKGEHARSALIDHRYFFLPDVSRCGCVCGVAWNSLAILLRKELANHFFMPDLVEACRAQKSNSSVQGFLAEQIVLSLITRDGFSTATISASGLVDMPAPDGGAVCFPRPPAPATLNPATEKSSIHYIPEAYNYKHIDSLLRQVDPTFLSSSGSGKKKVETYGFPSTLRIVAFQPTLQPVAAHSYSLDFFGSGDYARWQGADSASFADIERHFVWVVRQAEFDKVKASYPKLAVKIKGSGGATFTEHVVPFSLFGKSAAERLDFL